MDLLFDSLGPSARAPEVSAALNALAAEEGNERGAVFTRPLVANAILDLLGYTSDCPLHRMRLLEPAFGGGDFLLPVVERLLAAYFDAGGTAAQIGETLAPAIRAVELHPQSVEIVRGLILARLALAGVGEDDANHLCDCWLICDDFLLCALPGSFDVVVGNPPYVRQERIPASLLAEYRLRYRTLYDRADLYIPFYERSLDLLARQGLLGFICANRWVKNRYGGPLRQKISAGFQLRYYIDMEGVDAFHTEVIAYPAITIIERTDAALRDPARVATTAGVRKHGLEAMVSAIKSPGLAENIEQIELDGGGDAPWLFDDVPRLRLLRRLEAGFPSLEEADCKVSIGVATGCDRVFIGDFDALPVEPSRKLPLVMARDLVGGRISWGGKGVVNPFEEDGRLASLEDWPEFSDYLHRHHGAIAGRHVALRNPGGWYRTIDRITPSLMNKPKLLVPDIKGEAMFVFDEGRYYPHHNLYYITSDTWDLRALRAVLRSSLSVMILATYCTRMSGGFLRFQAQYLRRLRLPHWRNVTLEQRRNLVSVTDTTDADALDSPVFALFGLSEKDGQIARKIADEAQVTVRKRRDVA